MSEEINLLVLGAILPPLIDLVNRYVPDTKLRFLVSLVVSVILGGVLAFLQFGDEIWQNAGLIFAAAQTVYKLWYKDTAAHTRLRG